MKTRWAVAFSLLVGACGHKAPAGPVGNGGDTAAAEAPPCPTGPALGDRVARLFGVPVDDLASEPSCATGHFPEAGQAIDAWLWEHDAPDGNSGITVRIATVDGGGELSNDTRLFEGLPPGVSDSSADLSLQAHDLDADGVDELLFVHARDHGGVDSEELVVLRLTGGAWVDVGRRLVKFDNSAMGEPPEVSCAATWKVEGAAIVITPAGGGGGSSEECASTVETWRLGADGTLAQQ